MAESFTIRGFKLCICVFSLASAGRKFRIQKHKRECYDALILGLCCDRDLLLFSTCYLALPMLLMAFMLTFVCILLWKC